MMALHNTRQAMGRQRGPMLIVAAVVALPLIFDAVPKLRDELTLPTPWLEVSLRIVPQEGRPPKIEYNKKARALVSGPWKGWLEIDGARYCDGNGMGTYAPSDAETQLWTFEAFLGRSCDLPTEPYRVCSSYALERPSGARRKDGPFCSEIYDGSQG